MGTPIDRGQRWVELAQRNGHGLPLNAQPGALHAFDAPAMPHVFAGHYRAPAAAADALVATRRISSLLTSPHPDRRSHTPRYSMAAEGVRDRPAPVPAIGRLDTGADLRQ